MNYLQCGAFSRAQDHLEGSSDLVECTRSKHLHIQAVDRRTEFTGMSEVFY